MELAFALPILLLLALLVTEGAGMVRTYQVVDNAAREGARLSSLQQNKFPGPACAADASCTCDDGCVRGLLEGAVKQYAQNNGLDPTKMNVDIIQTCGIPASGGTPTTCAACPGVECSWTASRADVTYQYDFTFLPRLPRFGFNPQVVLTAESVFRNMY